MVEFDEILVPVDGSDGARRAAEFAARLGAAIGTPLRLAYVVPLTTDAVLALVDMTPDQVHALHQEQGEAVLGPARAALAVSGVKASVGEIVMVGDAAEEILNYLEAHPKTLVVMGRRGLSAIRGLMLGSVSEKVARHARVPVTLVH